MKRNDTKREAVKLLAGLIQCFRPFMFIATEAENYSAHKLLLLSVKNFVSQTNEPPHGKTNNLNMRKQSHRSASR